MTLILCFDWSASDGWGCAAKEEMANEDEERGGESMCERRFGKNGAEEEGDITTTKVNPPTKSGSDQTINYEAD